MHALPPQTIGDAELASSTVAESEYGVWTSGATYADRQRVHLGSPSAVVTISNASPAVVTWAANGVPDGTPVRLTTTGALPAPLVVGQTYYVVNRQAGQFELASEPGGPSIPTTTAGSGTHTATAQVHKVFQSTQGSNTNHPPAVDDGTWWSLIGPTNKFAMLDNNRSTPTEGDSPMVVQLTPGKRVDGIAAFALVADRITFSVVVDGEEKYSYTEKLKRRSVSTWRQYYFSRFRQKSAVARFDLYPYRNATITMTLERASGRVRCGDLVVGQKVWIGDTEWNPQNDARSFSDLTFDEFGQSQFVPRREAPTNSIVAHCPPSNIQSVLDLRRDLNGKVAVWSGLDDVNDHPFFEGLLILGAYTRFVVAQPVDNLAKINIETIEA